MAEVREHWLGFWTQTRDGRLTLLHLEQQSQGSVHSLTFRVQPCHHQSIAVNGDYCEEAEKC